MHCVHTEADCARPFALPGRVRELFVDLSPVDDGRRRTRFERRSKQQSH
jgi:ribosomal protein S10